MNSTRQHDRRGDNGVLRASGPVAGSFAPPETGVSGRPPGGKRPLRASCAGGPRGWWRTGLSALLALGLATAAPAFDKSEFDDTNILVQNAVNHIYQKRYKLAFEVLKQAYEKSPRDPQVHFNLGRVYELTGNFGQAQQEYQVAAVLDPSMIAARRGMARVGVEIKRQMVMARTEAMETARAAAGLAGGAPMSAPPQQANPVPTRPTVVQQVPETPAPPAMRAAMVPETKLPAMPAGDGVVLPKTSEIRVPPLPPEAARPASSRASSAGEKKGEALLEQGDARAAVPLLEQARNADPDNPRVLYLLGRGYTQLGDLFEAIKYLEEALRVDEGLVAARYLLAQNYAKVNLLDEAVKNYRQYYEIKPNAKVAIEIAQLYEKMGQLQDARDFYGRAQSGNPTNVTVQNMVNRADASLAQKLYVEGCDAFGRGDYRKAEKLLGQAYDTQTLGATYMQDIRTRLEVCRVKIAEITARERPMREGFAQTRKIYGTLNLHYNQLLTIPFQTRFTQPVMVEWRGHVAREVTARGQKFLLMIKELSEAELDEMRRDRNDYQLNPKFVGQPLFLLKASDSGFPPFARPGAMMTFSAKTDYQSFEVTNDLGQRVKLPTLELVSAHP